MEWICDRCDDPCTLIFDGHEVPSTCPFDDQNVGWEKVDPPKKWQWVCKGATCGYYITNGFYQTIEEAAEAVNNTTTTVIEPYLLSEQPA